MKTELFAYYSELRQAAQERRAKIEAAYKEENSGLAPTLDANGRYHAPCQGYMLPKGNDFIIEYRGDYDDHIFGAGEYLPVPITEEDNMYEGFGNPFHNGHKEKVRTTLEKILELDEYSQEIGIIVAHGRTWFVDGQEMAIAYISGLKKMVIRAAQLLAIETKNEEEKEPEPEVYMPLGKHTVTGTIIHTKQTEGFYGYSIKMLVKTEQGHKLWGSLPSKVDKEYRGKIEFTALFQPGQNGMSWFKRPSAVKLIEE